MEPAFHHWFPQNAAWTALKPPPNVLKNPHEPAFHPWVFPKRSLDSPKTTPNPPKKNPEKKKKEFPKQFRTLEKKTQCYWLLGWKLDIVFCALAKIVFAIVANFLGNDLEEIDTNSMM